MKVQELMTTKIVYVDGNKSVYHAVEKMVDRRIRSVVVKLPGEKPDYGVITARDLVFKVLAAGRDPNAVKASEIASKPLVCIDQQMEVVDAAVLMEKEKIARAFVCDETGIIGVLSLLDLMAGTLIMRARGEYVPG